MKQMMRVAAIAIAGMMALSAAANTWYVDDAKYGASGAGT